MKLLTLENIIHNSDSMLTSFYCHLIINETGATVPLSCPSPIPLGMASKTIADCQITASFSPDANAAAHHARLNGPSGMFFQKVSLPSSPHSAMGNSTFTKKK